MCATFYLEFSLIFYGPSLLKSIGLGLCYGLIGFNIQHDANHGALSKNIFFNNSNSIILCLFINFCKI